MPDVKQLSPAGVASFLKSGGVLTVYRKGCPSCQALHTRGSATSVMQKLAGLMDASGDGRHSCVANTERVLSSLPEDARATVTTYPAIFMADGSGRMEPYTGPRTAEAMYAALQEMDRQGVRDREPAQGQVEQIGSVADLRAVMEKPGQSAVVWMPCKQCDAASKSATWAAARASLEAIARHPAMTERHIKVVATSADVAEAIKAIPTSGVAQLPATFLVQRGTEAYTTLDAIEPHSIVAKMTTLHDTPGAQAQQELSADRATNALLYDDVARWVKQAPRDERQRLRTLLAE
jgi:hypothetical protein